MIQVEVCACAQYVLNFCHHHHQYYGIPSQYGMPHYGMFLSSSTNIMEFHIMPSLVNFLWGRAKYLE